jgi:hypothetical protein
MGVRASYLSRICVETVEVPVDDVCDGVCEADVEVPCCENVDNFHVGRVRCDGAR